MKPLKKYVNGGLQPNEPLTNRQFRQNERARSRAERDARIVGRGADDVEGLMENLDDYYKLKDRDIAGKAVVLWVPWACLLSLHTSWSSDAEGPRVVRLLMELYAEALEVSCFRFFLEGSQDNENC